MMPISVTDLPTIIDVLAIEGQPQFVILRYRDFITFVITAGRPEDADVVSVLDVGDEHELVVLAYESLRRSLVALEITGKIDESAYLARHQDVAEAVALGTLRNASEHYVIQGYFERRIVSFPIEY
jgi:hypothetical protein